MKKAAEIDVKGTPVRVLRAGEGDYICLTDIAAGRGDGVRAADEAGSLRDYGLRL